MAARSDDHRAEPPLLEDTVAALRASWDRDSSDDPEGWSPENRALGQCALSALVLRAVYGGDVLIATVLDAGGAPTPDGHAWNRLPSGQEVDCSFDQFRDGERLGAPVVTEPVVERDLGRVQRLADRVGAALGRRIDVGPSLREAGHDA